MRYAGRVFGGEELEALVDASLDFYLTAGRFTEEFEAGFAEYLDLSDALLVNSGSSANLLAVTALTSPTAGRASRCGPATRSSRSPPGFPTTVAPIVQNGLVPVFVDVELGDYNADPDRLRAARRASARARSCSPTRWASRSTSTRSWRSCEEHDLWLVEDNCDALGLAAIAAS